MDPNERQQRLEEAVRDAVARQQAKNATEQEAALNLADALNERADSEKIGAAVDYLRVRFQDRMLPILRAQEEVSRQIGADIGENSTCPTTRAESSATSEIVASPAFRSAATSAASPSPPNASRVTASTASWSSGVSSRIFIATT